jgi:leader peptidase (prepilin peptidase)/N-methyltransferase
LDPFLAFASVLLGLAFGSFLNVCIYRLPRDMSVLNPRWSACPHCKRPIAFYDNVPVLSWLLLRGRCRKCQAAITPRYLVIELLTAALFLACAWHFGMTLATVKYCALSFLLLGLIFTDAETKLLPDKMTLTGLGLGIVFSLFVPVNDLRHSFFRASFRCRWTVTFPRGCFPCSILCWARPLARHSSTAPGRFTCERAGLKAWVSAM